MSAHNMLHEMVLAPHEMPDPGDAGVIAVDRQLAIMELVTAAAETRTLAAPTRPGLRLCLRMKTDGGDCVVTAAAGLNVAVNTTATLADVGDLLDLVAVSAAAGGYRWEILVNTGSVALA